MPNLVTEDEFWRRTVETVDGCLLWTYSTSPGGHATIHRDGVVIGAHRVAAEYAGMPVGPGEEIDHICHTYDPTCFAGNSCLHRRCVNPGHLEVVPRGENAARAHRRTEFCKQGHEFDDANTKWISRGPNRAPSRACRKCGAIAQQRYRDRVKYGDTNQ